MLPPRPRDRQCHPSPSLSLKEVHLHAFKAAAEGQLLIPLPQGPEKILGEPEQLPLLPSPFNPLQVTTIPLEEVCTTSGTPAFLVANQGKVPQIARL